MAAVIAVQSCARAGLAGVSPVVQSVPIPERPTILFTEFNANGPRFDSFALAADGRAVLGASFETNSRIWQLQADGTLDTSFQAQPSLIPMCVSVLAFQPDGKILAGGSSSLTDGLKLLRFNRNGSVDSGFVARIVTEASYGGVSAIEVLSGGSIYIRGDIVSVDDLPRLGMALLKPDGSLDPRFDPVMFQSVEERGNGYRGQVNTIVAQPDGKLLVGGRFSAVAGVPRENLVRLNSGGSIDLAFAPAFQKLTGLADVSFLQVQTDGKLVLAGYTTNTTASGALLFTLARLFPDGTVDASFRPETQVLAGATLVSLQLDGEGKVLVGGALYSGLPYVVGPWGYWERLLRFNQDGALDRNLTAGLEQAGGFAMPPMTADDQGQLFGKVFFLSPDVPVQTKLGRFQTDYSIPGAGFANESIRVSETNSTAVITVLRSGDVSQRLSVRYSTRDSTAKAGVNYISQSGILAFAPLEISQSFTVPVLHDARATGDVTVLLDLASTDTNPLSGSPLSAVLTIQDAETPLFLDPSFDPQLAPDTGINSILVQPDGKILVAGALTGSASLLGIFCQRLNADGTRDSSFTPTTGSVTLNNTSSYEPFVFATALQSDGRILLGGAFEGINGQAHTNIVRLNPDGSVDTNFNARVEMVPIPPRVNALAIQPDGKIIIGGRFYSVNGAARSAMARLNSDGSLDAEFKLQAPLAGDVFAVALQADGKVLVGSYQSSQGVFRINSNGSTDDTFALAVLDPSRSITSIASRPDGKIVLSTGDRLNPDGSIDPTFRVAKSHSEAGACYVDAGVDGILGVQADGKVWVRAAQVANCNNFNTVAYSMMRLNPDGSTDFASASPFVPGEQPTVWATEASGSVLIGGNFRTVNGIKRNGLARLFANAPAPVGVAYVSSDGHAGADGQNATLTVQRLGNSQDAFSVKYTTVNGTAQAGASFEGQSGTIQFGPLETSKTIAIPIYDRPSDSPDEQFQVVLSEPSNGVVLNTGPSTEVVTIHNAKRPGSVDFGFVAQLPFLGNAARLLLQQDGKVLVSGIVSLPESGMVRSVVRLNLDGTVDNSFELHIPPHSLYSAYNFSVLALAQQSDGKIVLGGNFRDPLAGADTAVGSHLISTLVYPNSPSGIARVNSDGTLDQSFHPGTGVSEGAVRVLAIQPDGQIVIGGDFKWVNGISRRGIARLNATGELDQTFDAAPGFGMGDVNVTVLQLQTDGKLILGGSLGLFQRTAQTLARLNLDGSVDPAFHAGAGADLDRLYSGLPRISSLAVQTDGKILVSGAFNSFDGVARPCVARVNADGSLDQGFWPDLQLSDQSYSRPLSVAVQADGKVLVAGLFFRSSNRAVRAGIARLNSDGTLDESFDPGAGTAVGSDCCNQSVSSMLLKPDGSVLLGGPFTSFDQVPRQGLVQLHGTAVDPASLALVSPKVLNGKFTFNLQTLRGQTYAVEQNTSLSTAQWLTYTNVVGNGTRLELVIPLTTNPRFFRVHQP